MKIGFIGLGNIGLPLAMNLQRSGQHEVIVHDLDRQKCDQIVDSGAIWARNSNELAAQVDTVITSLPGPRAVRAAVEGPSGVIQGLRPGATWIEMSTSDRSDLLRIATRLSKLGCTTLDCPVTGGINRAEQAQATFFVSGDPDVYSSQADMLAVMARDVYYFGALGNAMTAKLITNLLAFAHEVILGEGLMLGKLAGLDLVMLGDAIASSYGASVISELHTSDILDGSFESKFALELAIKDLDLVAAAAAEANAPFHLGELVRDRFKRAGAQYDPRAGDLVHVRLLEEETGVLLRP